MVKQQSSTSSSGIRDNHGRGTVGEFLVSQLRPGADLDLVTAYFTVFAYDKLREPLNELGSRNIEQLRFQPDRVSELRDLQIQAPWSPLNRLKGANPEAFHYWYQAQRMLIGS